MQQRKYRAAAAAASFAALAAVVLGALFLIAPVWQPGRRPRAAFAPADSAPAPQAAAAPLDINTATAEELTALPGIGTAKAEAIVAFRQEHGPFAALEDVAAVNGISARMAESWQGLAVAGSPEP